MPETKQTVQHTALPFSTGRTLNTYQTLKWSEKERADNDRHEAVRVFAHFTAEDQGRSRKLVAHCETPEDAAFIVQACNAYDDLVAALENLINECDEADGFDPNLEGSQHQVLEAAREALLQAKGR